MIDLSLYKNLSMVDCDAVACAAVDICLDEILSPEQFDKFYNICKKKRSDMYTLKGFNSLIGMLTEEELTELDNLL